MGGANERERSEEWRKGRRKIIGGEREKGD